jgi:hypothetical protein
MRSIGLGLIGILLVSGCAFLPTRVVVLGGVNDMVNIPVGAKTCGIALPTDEENKTYCVVSTKPMRLVSMDAWNNLEKECK